MARAVFKEYVIYLKSKAFVDGVCLPEIFALESYLGFEVGDSNLGDMMTEKLMLQVYLYKVLKQRHALYTFSENDSISSWQMLSPKAIF